MEEITEERRQHTNEELEHMLFHKSRMEEERKISDSKYAIKLVETIVFAMVGIIMVGVLTALVALVVR